jgi:hypothetical protein
VETDAIPPANDIGSLLLCCQSPFPSGLLDNDGVGSRMLLAQELEEIFPSYDSSGQRVTPVYSHYRMLEASCPTQFSSPDCEGSCSDCDGAEAAICIAKQLKCKAENVQALDFPFSKKLRLLRFFRSDVIQFTHLFVIHSPSISFRPRLSTWPHCRQGHPTHEI